MVVCGEHLSHDILHYHTLIHFQFVEQEFLVQFHRHLAFFIESVRDKQSGVGHIAFEGVAFHIKTQSHIGCGAVVADVYNAGVGKPEEGVVVVTLGRDGNYYFYFSLPESQVKVLPEALVHQALSIAQKVERIVLRKKGRKGLVENRNN